MFKKIIWIILLVAALLLIWWGGKRTPAPETTSEPIKIGAILVLSGDGAAWGEAAKQGLDLAIEEFKTRTNREVEVIIENSEGQPAKALSAFQKLITLDKVNGIVGPLLQSETAAISPVVSQYNVPVVTPSYAPIVNRPDPRNPLMIWMDPTVEAERMAEFVYSAENMKKIGILGTRDNWENQVTEAFAKKFVDLGGMITNKQIVQPDTSDVRSAVTKIVVTKPEAIFLGTYYQFVQATRVIKELGFSGALYSIEVDNYLANETKQYTSNLRFIAPDVYGGNFIQKFEARYAAKPGMPAGQTYDATSLLLTLFHKHKTPSVVIEELKKLSSYQGTSGPINFTADHRTLLPTAFFEINDGQFKKLED